MINAGRHTFVPDDVDCNIDLEIGAFCSIASGLTIVSGQHPPVEAPKAVSTFPFQEHGWGDYPPSTQHGKVVVGSDVWIGQNVTILDGVEVGNGAIIGAGAVVTGDVWSFTIVAGNPARMLRHRFPQPVAFALARLRWWEWADDKIQEALPAMKNAADFIRGYGDGGNW